MEDYIGLRFWILTAVFGVIYVVCVTRIGMAVYKKTLNLFWGILLILGLAAALLLGFMALM